MVKVILVCYQRQNDKTDRYKNASCVNGPYTCSDTDMHMHAICLLFTNMQTQQEDHALKDGKRGERWSTKQTKMKRCHTFHTKKPNDSSAENEWGVELTWWHRWNDKDDDGHADERGKITLLPVKTGRFVPCWQVVLWLTLSILTVAFWYTSRALLTVSVLDQELFLTSGPAWSTDVGPLKVRAPLVG